MKFNFAHTLQYIRPALIIKSYYFSVGPYEDKSFEIKSWKNKNKKSIYLFMSVFKRIKAGCLGFFNNN